MALVKIEVLEVKEITTQDGHKFNAFKTLDPVSKKKIDLRFVRTAKNVPETPCFIAVQEENTNIDNSGRFPVCWVKTVEYIIPKSGSGKKSGFEEIKDEDIPF